MLPLVQVQNKGGNKMGKKHIVAAALALLVVAAVAGIYISGQNSAKVRAGKLADFGSVTMFKSPDCNCCGIYSQYLNGRDFTVNIVPTSGSDLAVLKSRDGIPPALRSCHTMKIGKYFVEGHVPAEAIDKLLSEKPDIAGIAMPGMPSGSPGMPGGKTGLFIVYAVNRDGSFQEFMRL